MYLDNAHTPVEVLKQALPVLQIPEPLLVVLVVAVHTEKFKRVFDFFAVRGAERKFQTDIVLHFLVVHVAGILRHEIDSGVHGASGTDKFVGEGFPLCHL